MKHRIVFLLAIVMGLMGVFVPQFTVTAQNAAVKCGDIIKGSLSQANSVASYPILLAPGDKVSVYGQPDGSSKIVFALSLDAPSGIKIFPRTDVQYSSTPNLDSGRMSAYGIHTIKLANQSGIGSFQISVSCELNDGTIIPAGSTDEATHPIKKQKTITLPISDILGTSQRKLECGDVIAGEFTQNEQIHTFSLEMAGGDISFSIGIQPIGDGLWISGFVKDPSSKTVAGTSFNMENTNDVIPAPNFNVTEISQGIYRIFASNTMVAGWNSSITAPGERSYMGGIGLYVLSVSCILKGNKSITPDLTKLEQVTEQLTADTSAAPAPTNPPATQAPAPTEPALTTTTTTQTVTCAASPATRLYVGAHGKVAPGDANNLRDEPSGKSIAKMPPGSEFDIIEGPQCGRTGLTFWKVQYGDLVGWTAEGQGTEYWLEPVEDGRG